MKVEHEIVLLRPLAKLTKSGQSLHENLKFSHILPCSECLSRRNLILASLQKFILAKVSSKKLFLAKYTIVAQK